MSVQFEINKRDLEEALKLLERTGANMEKAIPRVISDTTTAAYREAKRIADAENIRRTGLYQKSMRMRLEGSGVNTVGIVGDAARDARTGFPYPIVIEEGSAPHTITATVAKCLHFFAKSGDEVFVGKPGVVHHPGTKARHVFRRAAEFAVREIGRIVHGWIEKRGK